MAREHINNKDLVKFAQNKVNLPKDKANEFRAQVRRLREKLETYIAEHPDFTIKRMMLSGSLAKGTALRSLNDIDVACYISGADVPSDIPKLLDYLIEKLKKAFPNFSSDQIQPQTYSITVSFRGTGLDVDVVPILYYDDPDWYGNIVSQDDGSLIRTNIPQHIDFISKRKQKHGADFAQIVRLVKFWANKEKNANTDFRFKSFMIEMILSHLSDTGYDFSDYPEALQAFFTYIAKTDMQELITFNDYHDPDCVDQFTSPIKIIDPVNSENNVASLYTKTNADLIVNAALEAGDAIDAALLATTKQQTIYYWQKVFGSTFQV